MPLVVIMKRRIEELAAILFGAKARRLLTQGGGMPEHVPLVSIHIPACREPPEMLRQTLDAVAALDWPNFECVVVINNTPDPRHVAADRGSLPAARRALQIRPRRQVCKASRRAR